MKFIAIWNLKPDVDQVKLAEAMGRRSEWEFPEGVTLLAEYWSPQGDPVVVDVLECEDTGTLIVNTIGWVDVVESTIFPVVTWEEGLAAISTHLAGE